MFDRYRWPGAKLGVVVVAFALVASSLAASPAGASEMNSTVSESPSGAGGVASSTSAYNTAFSTIQAQTEWYVNDDPTLFGPSGTWNDGNAGHGYGSNNFKWTYAIGGEASASNWAHWYMGDRVGRQRISVYVPSNQATATVRYNIYKDNSYFTQASIAQAGVSGWTTLGTWDFNNADVLISVQDNEAVQNYLTHGTAASRIAVDAVAMICVSNCTNVSPPGQVDYNTVDYVVTTRASGAGRVTWGSVLAATSYDLELEIGTERISDGVTDEGTHSLQNVSCCERQINVSHGYRITAISMRVRAVNSAGSGLWSVEIIEGLSYAVDRPSAVTDVSFSSGRISWNAAARATAYDVQWRQDGEQNQQLAALCCSLDITYVGHKDLRYRVRGKNQNGTQFGPWTSWQTHEGEEEPVDAPTTAPSGFAWVPGDSMWSGRLTWNALSDATAYDVDWRNEGGATIRQTVHCTSSCGLGLTREPQKDLQFRIRAQNEGGSGPWSAWQVEAAAIQLPGDVTGLSYSGGRLRWNRAPSATTERYDIAYKLGGESSHHIARDVSCCDYALSRPTGGSIRVALSAVNSDGRGPWTAWTTVVAADQPARVTGVQWSNGTLSWNAANGAAFYDVAYKHGSDDTEYQRNVACCQMRLAQRLRQSLQANVLGRTTERLGEWSGWQTLAEAPKPGTVSGVEYSNSRITWQAASNADWYRIRWTINGQLYKDNNVKCCSTIVGTVDVDETLRATLLGESPNGTSPAWSPWKTLTSSETDTRNRDSSVEDDEDSLECPSGNKYELHRERGFFGSTLRVKAAQTFHTINGKKITKGTLGGNVWGKGALSQSGCSWIFKGGEANDKAKVSGNAIVYGKLHDSSKASGNAHIRSTGVITGDKASVSGNATIAGKVLGGPKGTVKVSGNARVAKGAEVKHYADVAGSAIIYGIVENKAKVWGCAKIYGRVEGGAWVSGAAEVWGKVGGTAHVGSITPCTDLGQGGPVIAARVGKDHLVTDGTWLGGSATLVWDKRTLLFDDDDATLKWMGLRDASAYEIDWRYQTFDAEELGRAFNKALKDGLSDAERQEVMNLFVANHKGKLVTDIQGNSRPARGTGSEVLCRVSTKKCQNKINGDESTFNPEHPQHTIHSVQTHLLLQARVRGVYKDGSTGNWSEWASWAGAKESLVCVALDAYKWIQDIQFALRAVDFVVTGASIVSAVVSAGTSTLAGAALKQALKHIAKRMLEKRVMKELLEKVVKKLILDFANDSLKNTVTSLFAFLAGCVMSGMELNPADSADFWVNDVLKPSALGLAPGDIEKFIEAVNW